MEMGEKSLLFYLRNDGRTKAGKLYNSYPGTLALGGNCLCSSSVFSNAIPNWFQI